MPRFAPVLIVLALAILGPRPADAHQRLIGSHPTHGDSVAVGLSEIRLTFNQPVEPALARLTIRGPAGPVHVRQLALLASAPEVLVAALSSELSPGVYSVAWLVTSSDGHPVSGDFSFVVVGDESAPAAAAEMAGDRASAGPGTTTAGDAQSGRPSFSSGSPAYAAVRWLSYITLIVAIGTVAFALILVPGAARRSGGGSLDFEHRARGRAATLGVIAASGVIIAAALRLLAQTAAVGMGPGGEESDLVAAMLTRTTWGWGWIAQTAAAAVLLILLLTLRRAGSPRSLWPAAGVAAAGLAFTPGLSGHAAAATTTAVIADGVHVLAAGVWIGSLLCLIAIALPLTRAGGPVTLPHLLGAFSPIALLSAAVLGLTGFYAATIHLPNVASLLTTAYGRTLALKLSLFLLVLVTGAYNWRRATPTVTRSGNAAPLRASAIAELVIVLAVLAVTAVLVATPPP